MRRVLTLVFSSFTLLGLVALAYPALSPAQEGADGDGAEGEPAETTANDPTDVPPTRRPRPTEEERSPEDRARRAQVIARVGDVRITVGEVEDAIDDQSPFLRARYRDREQLQRFVEGLVRVELLAREAERRGIGDDPEVQRATKQNGVQQLIRRDFDERITVESVPDARVRAYYDRHPQEFSRDETRRASHIQLGSADEARQLLEEAREADARRFRELAREHSLDPETRMRGGDLRYFDASGRSQNSRDPQVDEALARAAFRLTEVGDVSDPVRVGERYSIVKLTGRRPAEHRAFEQAAPSIRLRLWRERRQEALEELVSQLRENGDVEVHEERLAPIELDPPERAEDPHDHGDRPAPEADPAE